MSTITDLLTQFPNCRVTISSGPRRKKPYEGQLRVLVRKGRPVWDWVSESSLSAEDQKHYAQRRAERGEPL